MYNYSISTLYKENEQIMSKKFQAGWYEANEPVTVVTSLNFKSKKNKDGTVDKTWGLWATDKQSFIKFVPGKPVELTEEQVNAENIKQLIENRTLKRVYKQD